MLRAFALNAQRRRKEQYERRRMTKKKKGIDDKWEGISLSEQHDAQAHALATKELKRAQARYAQECRARKVAFRNTIRCVLASDTLDANGNERVLCVCRMPTLNI